MLKVDFFPSRDVDYSGTLIFASFEVKLIKNSPSSGIRNKLVRPVLIQFDSYVCIATCYIKIHVELGMASISFIRTITVTIRTCSVSTWTHIETTNDAFSILIC